MSTSSSRLCRFCGSLLVGSLALIVAGSGCGDDGAPPSVDSARKDGGTSDSAKPDASKPDGSAGDGPLSETAGALYTLSGTVEQFGGPNLGTDVYIRLYVSSDPAKIREHIAEQRVTTISGQNVTGSAYSFQVPSGTYYLRAWRDDSGRGGAPDGQPSLTTDAQSSALMVIVGGAASTSHVLKLLGRGNTNDSFDNFDVRSVHVIDGRPPIGEINNIRVSGNGRCGGFFISLSAERAGATAALSTPRVALPNSNVVTLLDDGGCGADVLDNISSSFDDVASDGILSYGIPTPTASDAGAYTFYYHQSTDDFIHIEVDHVASVVQLARARQLTGPTGAMRNTNLSPNITWQPVVNAGYYEVNITSLDGTYDNYGDVNRVRSATSYTPVTALIDDACYHVTIRATDANPAGDVDAESVSPGDRFCTDVDGAQSITLSGTLANNTGNTTAPVQIYVTTHDTGSASVRLPGTATSWSVSVLAGAAGEGALQAFVDPSATQQFDTPANRRRGLSLSNLDLTATATRNLQLNPGPRLAAPSAWATAVPDRPTLSWEDYGLVTGRPSGPWSYLLTIGDAGNARRARIVLSSTTTSIDLLNLPARAKWFDLTALASCDMDSGTFSVAANGQPVCTGGTATPSQTVLAAATLHDWFVDVIRCDFTQFAPPATGNLLTCLRDVLTTSAVYATSDLRHMMSR